MHWGSRSVKKIYCGPPITINHAKSLHPNHHQQYKIQLFDTCCIPTASQFSSIPNTIEFNTQPKILSQMKRNMEQIFIK